MRRRAFSNVSDLLNDLIDRLESKPGSTRLLAYIDEEGFDSVLERDRFERQLEKVERIGGIHIQRRSVDGDQVIAHVRLADPKVLYREVGRQPGKLRAANALSDLRRRKELPDGSQAVLDEIEAAWARGVGRFRIQPGDAASLEQGIDLLLALVDRARDPSARSTDFRSFSRRAGADSKALERLSGTVAGLLTRLHPDLVTPTGLDPDDLLATFGISKTPQPLLISAPLKIAERALPGLSYYGFPPEEAAQVQLAAHVDYVLTIENYVSFVRHVREVNLDRSGLIMYTGGFPARSHLSQIVRIAKATDAPIFHWGDMDAGGVRIFRHLEEALAVEGLALRPHLMDQTFLKKHGAISSNQRRLIPGACSASAISALWDLIAETGLAHEQESLDPRRPAVVT